MRVPTGFETIRARWGAELSGASISLERLERVLSSALRLPFDPFVARFRNISVLQTARWNEIDDSWVVRDLARAELMRLEGVGRLTGSLSPLSVENIIELDLNGDIVGESISSNEVFILSADEIAAQDFRRRYEAVKDIEMLQEAVTVLSGQVSWFDIYRAIECLKDYFGGEQKFNASLGKKGKKLKHIKRTANVHRHRADAFESFNNLVPMHEGEKFVREVIIKLIDKASSTYEPNQCSTLTVPQYSFSDEQKIGARVELFVNGQRAEIALEGDIVSVSDPC